MISPEASWNKDCRPLNTMYKSWRETREFSLLDSSFYSDLAFQLLRQKKQKVQSIQLLYSEWFIKFNELIKLLWRFQETLFLSFSYLCDYQYSFDILDAFKLWCWWLLRVPWTSRSSQFIQKDISPEYSLEGLMLKLKLQYFGHLIQRTDSFEKTQTHEKMLNITHY